MFIFLPDSPVSAPMMNKKERKMAVERLRENQTGVENKRLKPYQVLEAFKDYKLYFFFTLGLVCTFRSPDMLKSSYFELTSLQAIFRTVESQISELLLFRGLAFPHWSLP